MKFTDIECNDCSDYQYYIPLEQHNDHDVEAYIELIMEEDEYYLEIRTWITPEKLPFGQSQPEVAFRNFDLDEKDFSDAQEGTSDKLMNLLEKIRKALSFLTFGEEDAFQFILNN